MAKSSGYATARDVHDGVDARSVALTNGNASASIGATGFPTGSNLDFGDGGFTVLVGDTTLDYENTTKAGNGTAPADPTSDDQYTWDYSINGGTISHNTTSGVYTLESMTGDTTTITFTVKTRTVGSISVKSETLVATLSLSRQGTTGTAASAFQGVHSIQTRNVFFLDRSTAGVYSLSASGNTAVTLTADPQGLGSGNVTWQKKINTTGSFSTVTDDDGTGTVIGSGDVQGQALIIKKGNFGITSEVIEYRALKNDTSGAGTGDNFSTVITITRSIIPANGTNGSSAVTTILDWISGNPDFRNNAGSETSSKASLYIGGVKETDQVLAGTADTRINSYAWYYTPSGSSSKTKITVGTVATITGVTTNNTRGGTTNANDYNFHTLSIEADGTALGVTGGGTVIFECEIDYT